MIETILYVLGAFCIYILLLPLLGVAVGLLVYVGLPYLAGIVMAGITYKILHGSFFEMGASYWLFGVVWAVLLVRMRQIFSKILELKHRWFEGHYLAASTIFLMGRPYRKLKKSMALE
ncbi:MAG: hypothetical protein OET90_02620 [Desulfuromonadales bacterium]|nr:hypothetical protein [Desulfuromonadales bacterium]